MLTSVRAGVAALTFAVLASVAAFALAQEPEVGPGPCANCPGRNPPVCCTDETCLAWERMPDGSWECSRVQTYYYYFP